MFKKLAIGCLILVVLVVGAGFFYVSSLPDSLDVSRERVIQATPAEIHALVGDVERWPDWSYWQSEDPGLEYSYPRDTTGPNAFVSWQGTAGDSGSMQFTSSDPASGIAYDLSVVPGEGMEPMTSEGTVTYEPVGEATRVTFHLAGPIEGVAYKFFSSVADLPGQLGTAFEHNLEHIAELVEGE